MSDISGLPALDVAIGLSFIFLILSLLATAVQEGIASLLALRARTLLRGVGNMLDGKDTLTRSEMAAHPKTLSARFYDHVMIRSLYRRGRGPWNWVIGDERLPSYIAPRAFSLALLDTIAPEAALRADGTKRAPHDVINHVTKALKGSDKRPGEAALLVLLKESRGDIDKFRQNVETWFDGSMARVSGWYKRESQLILMVIAVTIVLPLNANALTIGERLWKDPAVRAGVVEEAIKTAEPEPAPPNETREEATKRIQAAYDRVPEVTKLGVPIGWTSDAADLRFVGWKLEWRLLYHDVAGWLLTIMAISLGAPFWFDTLSRFSRLRSTGKPEQPLPASAFGQKNERVPSS